MELTALRDAMSTYEGKTPRPSDFQAFWAGRKESASETNVLFLEPTGIENPTVEYNVIQYDSGGRMLTSRCVRPRTDMAVPAVLLFSDFDSAVRGWFHMSRFAALGFAVLAPVREGLPPDATAGWRGAPEGLALADLYTDALGLSYAAGQMPGIDGGRLIPWGEGLGGTLAIVTAALRPEAVEKCAVLGPALADFPLLWQIGQDTGPLAGMRRHFRGEDPEHQEADAFFHAMGYVDCVNFASMVRCPFLMGTGLMDSLSPPLAQAAVFNSVPGKKRIVTYPKYIHERINEFENELLSFLHG